jgi:hypothetical protein
MFDSMTILAVFLVTSDALICFRMDETLAIGKLAWSKNLLF